jgi:hypothetical protein
VRRAENAARTKAPKPPKVKRSRVQGAGSFTNRNPKTGRFEKRRTVVYDLQYKSEWAGIESDGDENLVPGNIPRNAEAMPAQIPPKSPPPSQFVTPRHGTGRLLSKAPSPRPSNTRPETHIWIRGTPVAEDITLSENPSNIDSHTQPPRQTARMIWIRDTPGSYDEQPSWQEIDFTRSTPEPVQTSPSPSTEASVSPGLASMRTQLMSQISVAASSLTAVSNKAMVNIAEPRSSGGDQVEQFAPESQRIADAAKAMFRKQQLVAKAENRSPLASDPGRRQREEDMEVRKRLGESRDSKEERKSKKLKHKTRVKDTRRHSGRSKEELRAAVERKRTEAAVEAEVRGNEGRLGATKLRVDNILNNAWANSLLRAPEVTPASVVRQRSASMPTKAFQAARENEKRGRQSNGPFRKDIHADMNPYYVKGLLGAVNKSLKLPQNQVYGHHPETIYGFNLSSDDLPLSSIET